MGEKNKYELSILKKKNVKSSFEVNILFYKHKHMGHVAIITNITTYLIQTNWST